MFSEKVHVVNHPLLAHKLTILRDKNTPTKDFRELVSEIGMLLTYEATRDLPLVERAVETPICTTMAPTLKGKKFAAIPLVLSSAVCILMPSMIGQTSVLLIVIGALTIGVSFVFYKKGALD